MVPKCRVELVPSAPKCRKAEICLLENIRVSAEVCSGMSDGAVDHEVHANELKMSIKYDNFQQKHNKQNQLAKMSSPSPPTKSHRTLTLYLFWEQ